jgi:hypothetical protein
MEKVVSGKYMSKIEKAKNVFHKVLLKMGMIKQVSLFEVVHLKNVVVVPYEDLLDLPIGRSDHKGGPIWAKWDVTNNLRHKRVDYVDCQPSIPSTQHIYEEERPLFWCGAIAEHYDHQSGKLSGHFGHQVADFTSRLPSYIEYQKNTFNKAHYCFAVRENSLIAKAVDAPNYFLQILSWFEIDPSQVVIVDKPILAKSLLVTPQLELLNPDGKKLSTKYLDFLNKHVEMKLGKAKKNQNTFYISRSSIIGGELAGEPCLEEYFEKNGVIVIHPEKLSLTAQISLYREAKNLIFLEGSSLHCLQFLGVTDTNIFIINRRQGSNIMKNSLLSRFPIVEYFDITDLIHGLSSAGKKAKYDGISILNNSLFLTFIDRLNLDSSLWDYERFKKNERQHVKKWFESKRIAQSTSNKRSLDLITSMFSKVGIDIDEVMESTDD